jgi:hypothetical protein
VRSVEVISSTAKRFRRDGRRGLIGVSRCATDTVEEFTSVGGTAAHRAPLRRCTLGFGLACGCNPLRVLGRPDPHPGAFLVLLGSNETTRASSFCSRRNFPNRPNVVPPKAQGAREAMPSGRDEVAYWFALAAEARHVAAEMTDPTARLITLKIAQGYEHMARVVDERRKGVFGTRNEGRRRSGCGVDAGRSLRRSEGRGKSTNPRKVAPPRGPSVPLTALDGNGQLAGGLPPIPHHL